MVCISLVTHALIMSLLCIWAITTFQISWTNKFKQIPCIQYQQHTWWVNIGRPSHNYSTHKSADSKEVRILLSRGCGKGEEHFQVLWCGFLQILSYMISFNLKFKKSYVHNSLDVLMEANKWDSEVKKKGTQINKKKVPSLLIGEQHVDRPAITWSAARISGLAWPRAPNSSGSADANSSALVGVVSGEVVVDEEGEGGDVVGRIEDSGNSSVSLRDGICSWLFKIVFLRMIFSDLGVCTTGLKESSDAFAGDGLKVSAGRCLLTLFPEGTKSRGFRFPPVTLLPLFFSSWPDNDARTFSPWPSSRGPTSPYFPQNVCQKLFFESVPNPKSAWSRQNSALPTDYINFSASLLQLWQFRLGNFCPKIWNSESVGASADQGLQFLNWEKVILLFHLEANA